MKSFPIPEVPSVVTVRKGATLFTESDLGADPKNVTLPTDRVVRYIGKASDTVFIVGHDRSPEVTGKSAVFARAADCSGISPAVPATASR